MKKCRKHGHKSGLPSWLLEFQRSKKEVEEKRIKPTVHESHVTELLVGILNIQKRKRKKTYRNHMKATLPSCLLELFEVHALAAVFVEQVERCRDEVVNEPIDHLRGIFLQKR